jgi:hypothetical protein
VAAPVLWGFAPVEGLEKPAIILAIYLIQSMVFTKERGNQNNWHRAEL